MSAPPVEVFGIRHHGPGSARSLLRALQEYRPDQVLIEGPADADPLLAYVAEADMQPPLALLGYATDRPSVAAFWPFARFSPEWQAMRWAVEQDVPVGFCDLPAAAVLAPRPRTLLDEADGRTAGPDRSEGASTVPVVPAGTSVNGEDGDPDAAGAPTAADRRQRHDPLAVLAGAAGYDDPERWWDDLVESRLDGSSPFPLITQAIRAVRDAAPPASNREQEREGRREAQMRQTIRAAVRRGRQRVAVVCGAWHAPVLTWPLPPAAADARALRGQPRRKVALTWVPWTHQRLAASGYGAGVASPGWYDHLWSAPDRPVVRWLTRVARSLRDQDLAVSSAHVIDAARLAETLASLRGRPLAGLAEVAEATEAVLCGGDARAVQHVTAHLVVGQALGTVSARVPTVPLESDLAASCRSLRLRREATERRLDLDLRRGIDQSRSQLFHRLRLLELSWAEPARSGVQNQGTFRESWRLCWQPEDALRLIEAGVWGTTVPAAAAARVVTRAGVASLAELTGTLERCLLADLPDALADLLQALSDRAALDAEVAHLMDALPALARAERYGDVRGTDTAALRVVAETLLVRICAGLGQACGGLDQDGSEEMRRRLDAVHGAVGLLAEAEGEGGAAARDLRDRWYATLGRLLDRADLHPLLHGRLVRLLLDARRIDDAAARVHRALSAATPPAQKAAWAEGFLAGAATLLIHDAGLRALLDGWVADLSDEEFTEVLPLLRRTFGRFSPAERRTLAGRLASAADPPGPGAEQEVADLLLAAPALATVDLLLGLTDGRPDARSPDQRPDRPGAAEAAR